MSNATHLILYSHDTFGLGHIRRNRKIAKALVDRFADLHATIITGSEISGEYSTHPRIKYVEIPQVDKQPDGQYIAVGSNQTFDQVITARKEVINKYVMANPADLFIADKEPLGLGGELTDAIAHFKSTGTTLILGLRDVLDDPAKLRSEWERKGILGSLDGIYDQIWIYGSEKFYNPLADIGLSKNVLNKCRYTGFLYQDYPQFENKPSLGLPPNYLLVTAGGGGDGARLMDAVLSAYEADPQLSVPAVLLLGPYSDPDLAARAHARANQTAGIHIIGFDANPEVLIQNATAVIGMCGYNTFCEVIARKKAALFVPRQTPRLEQLIRAERARDLGYCDVILTEDAGNTKRMLKAIRQLIVRAQSGVAEHDFDARGLDRICDSVGAILRGRRGHAKNMEHVG